MFFLVLRCIYSKIKFFSAVGTLSGKRKVQSEMRSEVYGSNCMVLRQNATNENDKRHQQKELFSIVRSDADFNATLSASIRDTNEVARRNASLEKALFKYGLKTVDVVADGNCFFRSASCILYGNENNHSLLRECVASHIEQSGCLLNGIVNEFPDDGLSFLAHVKSIRSNGHSVGVDAAIALANVVGRSVIIHIADAEPQIFAPETPTNDTPIQLAFLEPGHYRAVVSVNM